jgi:predicted GH43/DUF377 family glycosyl hydrolase
MAPRQLKRWTANPILTPTGEGDWEAVAVCNPGAWYEEGVVYLLYRASAEYRDYVIHLGLATSPDGFHFTRASDRPVLSPSAEGFDAGCVEDARVVKYGDTFYITYAARPFPPYSYRKSEHSFPPGAPRALTENWTRTGLASSMDLRHFTRLGPMTADDADNRDVVLFPEKVGGRYLCFQRPLSWTGPQYGCERPSIWLAASDDLLHWEDFVLFAQSEQPWEEAKCGASSPPLRTEEGWLMIYHGVDANSVYRVGAMLLDRENPRRILARCPHPILEPEAPYEVEGHVRNVVFPVGNVVIGDELFVYYGGGDSVCAAATVPLAGLVRYVLSFAARKP